MSKKLKALLIIISIVVIIGLFFGISTIIRFFELNDIYNKIEKHIQKDNYKIITTANDKDSVTKTITYYRDGIGKFVTNNGIYTWTDGTKAYVIDEENKEAKELDVRDEKKSKTLISSNLLASLIPEYTNSFFDKIILAGNLKNTIKTETIDDEKCLKIEIKDENYIKTIWISKKTAAPVKSKIYFIESNETIETNYKITYQQTTLKDIELPDFTEYTVTKLDETTESEAKVENTAV